MEKRNRYKEFEQKMTVTLIADTVVFLLYLLIAWAGIGWLKVVLSILCIGVSIGSLALLYLTQELLKPRSLWMSTGFFAVLVCILVSLILAFP